MKVRRLSIQSVDVESVIGSLGILYERRGNELYAKCLNPSHIEKTPSWHICAEVGNKVNGVFNCWSCGYSGNIITLVADLKQISGGEAVDYIRKYEKRIELKTEFTTKDYERMVCSSEPEPITPEWKGEKIRLFHVESETKCWEYLVTRNIFHSDIRHFEIKDWRDKERVFIPIYRKERLISWIARTYRKDKIKVLAPEGAPKKWELFNLDRLNRENRSVNLCEGWADAIRLTQAGFHNVVALCGSSMSEYQANEFIFAKEIVLWMDGDLAGVKAAERIGGWLSSPERRFVVVPLPEGSDPGSCDFATLRSCQPILWSTYKQERKKK